MMSRKEKGAFQKKYAVIIDFRDRFGRSGPSTILPEHSFPSVAHLSSFEIPSSLVMKKAEKRKGRSRGKARMLKPSNNRAMDTSIFALKADLTMG